MSTITLTFAESCENHTGMEIIGKIAENGFSLEDLKKFKSVLGGELITMEQSGELAYLLIVRDGLSGLSVSDSLRTELESLEWDKKAFMYGRVVNKKARHNLCFADHNSEADYPNKKGTVINFNKLTLLNELREKLNKLTGMKLLCEGNYYYDISKTYIGMHGDTERKIVIGVRLGETFGLTFQWHTDNKPIGEPYNFELNNGDIYFMSEKAVGFDWKKSSKMTLRHSAQKV